MSFRTTDEETPTAEHFDLVSDPDCSCRVKLIGGRGRELAVSTPFSDSQTAVQGINAFRDIAATAVVKDRTSSAQDHGNHDQN